MPGWQALPERHRDAVSLYPVKVDHEWYSLLATLRRFQPVADTADVIKTKWAAAVDDRLMPPSDKTVGLARPLRDLALQVRAINVELQFVDRNSVLVTGSPARSPELSSIHEGLEGLIIARKRLTDGENRESVIKFVWLPHVIIIMMDAGHDTIYPEFAHFKKRI